MTILSQSIGTIVPASLLHSQKVDNDITNEVATTFEDILGQQCNMEKLMVFFPVILQKGQGVREPLDVHTRLASWLAQ